MPYEETIIDLDTPRPQWYLDINPRGLVPAIKYSVPGIYDDEIITESSTVSQFLVDSFPSPLMPSPREDPTAPLRRARMQWFIDTFNSKITPQQMALLKAPSAEQSAAVDTAVAMMEKEIEPLLKDAKPFYGGSEELTFVETQVAPFVLRLMEMSADGEHVKGSSCYLAWKDVLTRPSRYIPHSLGERLNALPNFGKWAKAMRGKKSVMGIYDAQATLDGFKRKYGDKFEKV